MPWKRKTLEGWNAVEYTSQSGRYVVRRRMMSGARNGTWRAEWILWDTRRHPVTGRPTWSDLDTLKEAKDLTDE